MMTPEQREIVQLVYACGAILSFFGSVFIIFTFLLFKEFRTLTTFLIFLLGIADAGLALGDLMTWFFIYPQIVSTNGLNIICQVQAGAIQYFALSSFFWTSCIAFHAYGSLFRKKHEQTLRSYVKYYFFICFILPATPLVVGYTTNIFNDTGAWCWIKNDKNIERFAFYYIPLILLWLFNLGIYILLSRKDSLSYQYLINQGRKRLRLYLLVLILCKLPALINRILDIFIHDSFFVPLLIQAIFDSLFGFFDSLVYGVTKARMDIVREKLCCCCRGKDSESTLGVHDPLIQRDASHLNTYAQYSSIAERMLARKHESYQNGSA